MITHCVLCAPQLSEILTLGAHAATIRQARYLVVAPRRHIAQWRDLEPFERAALAEAIVEAQASLGLDEAPGHVLLDERCTHLHFTVGAALDSPHRGPDIPTPHDRALIPGGDDALHPHLVPYIDRATQIDAVLAFVLRSGARMVIPHFQDLLDRGGRLRLLTGDYLDATEPEALRLLTDLTGNCEVRVYEASSRSFHPKSWLFRFDDGTGVLIVRSSNLSHTALSTGVEWNLRLFGRSDASPLRDAETAFDTLFEDPRSRPLSDEWIDAYAARRITLDWRMAAPEAGVTPEAPDAPIAPHEVQREALAALEASRRAGHRAGLVVLATGLGKTYLAALDSLPYARVLFVAHREEILTQAMAAFRRVRPTAHLGRYEGSQKDLDADILFASIQTLARAANLATFLRDRFDYVVVDEFHHAAARTYRVVIDWFTPKFFLGLTATPERTDGGDLLALCGENVVYRCDMWSGVERGLLSPFAYWGVPDPVEYAQIPWRNGRFDEAALTNAVATKARAENAVDQLRRRGGARALGFCVSQRHADFMASFASEAGLRAVAVHSGAGSAPRTSSLQALAEGALDIVFAVDMFNEGVDVPTVDTVLMLRPTESPVVWLQQFGRGLRLAPGKERLAVIDYIGNHRVFLNKARSLLQVGSGERALFAKLDAVRRGELVLPPGCEISYELEALDMMQRLLRRTQDGDELEAFYRDFRDRYGERPTAREVYHAGFDPRRTGHDGWFGFVADQGDLLPDERGAATAHAALLEEIAATSMTRAYKMLVLQAMIDEGAFPGAITIDRLAERVADLASRHPRLLAGMSAEITDRASVARLLRRYPLPAWSEAGSGRWFAFDEREFRTTLAGAADQAVALLALARELVDWRLARFLDRPVGGEDEVVSMDVVGTTPGSSDVFVPTGPEIWREFKREEIPPLFGAVFNTGSWNAGIVTIERAKAMVLLVTLEKGALL